MEILDIVHRAIQRSQLIPGFNPDECPEDYEQRVSDILVHELITDMNNDRGLDMTETVICLRPNHGIIDLVAPPADIDRFIVTLPYRSEYLLEVETGTGGAAYNNLVNALAAIGITEDTMPRYPVGELIPIGVWTQDLKFLECPKALPTEYAQGDNEVTVNPVYNVPFAPARVEGVVEASSGVEFDYKHAREFISAEFRYAKYVYMDEVYENKMRVRFHKEFADGFVEIVLPVPVTVVNYFDSPKPWNGKVIAPMKFREYLISMLAYRIADEYGLASAPNCEKAANCAYNNLLKNYPKRQHAMNVNRRIADSLRRPAGCITSADGFYGGYNG